MMAEIVEKKNDDEHVVLSALRVVPRKSCKINYGITNENHF